MIQLFISNNVPLSIGIISDFFGADPTIVSFINNLLGQGAAIEIASHTVNHTSLASQSLAVQIDVCTKSKNKIASQLPQNPRPITTLICPYDQFNQDTLTAARQTGYTAISAMMESDTATADGRVFYTGCSDTGFHMNISHVPSKAQTSTGGNGVRIVSNQVLADMEKSINDCGFSVVEMHFSEFSTPSGAVDNAGIADLVTIIQAAKSWNSEFTTLGELFPAPALPTPTPSPTPSPTSTPSPIPSPTPNGTETPTPTDAPPSNETQTPVPVSTPTNPTNQTPVPVSAPTNPTNQTPTPQTNSTPKPVSPPRIQATPSASNGQSIQPLLFGVLCGIMFLLFWN